MTYRKEEKLAHLERAKVYVENGEGTYTSYAKAQRIPRTTFHQWLHTFGYVEVKRKNTKPLVNLGKPIGGNIQNKQTFVVKYHGASIEVDSQGNLVALLKGIRLAEST